MANMFSRFLGKKDESNTSENKQDMASMMRDPRMMELLTELQSKLSPEDQKELLRRVISRDQKSVQEFLAAKVPDWQEMLKKHGLI